MKHLILAITFFSFLNAQNLQAQTKAVVLKNNQIEKIKNLKTKDYKLENGKTYKAYKIKNIGQYLNLSDLRIITPEEMENLAPGDACENSDNPCPEGYECKKAMFPVEDCGWFGWLFGCDTYLIERTFKECILVNAINNEN